jgi:uncharacterized protein YjbJ (UPF0337 family)
VARVSSFGRVCSLIVDLREELDTSHYPMCAHGNRHGDPDPERLLRTFAAAPRRGTTRASRSRARSKDMGNLDEAKGRAKQAVGDLTDDDDMRREGKVDEHAGKAKDKIGDAIDAVKDKVTDRD